MVTAPVEHDPGGHTGTGDGPGRAAPRVAWLVGRREFRDRALSRPLILLAALLAGGLLLLVLLQAFVFGRVEPIRVGLTGQAIALADTLPRETASLGLPVTVTVLSSVDDGTAQIRDGKLDVLVSGARAALHVTVDHQLDPRLRATLNSVVRQQVLESQLAQFGMRPSDVLSRMNQAEIGVGQLGASDPNAGQRIAVGLVTAALVTCFVAVFSGVAARSAAMDVRYGTAEVLLTVVHPRRLLVGTLTGLGAAGLVQLAGVALVGALAALITGALAVPGPAFVAFGVALPWFLLGFGLYGTLGAVFGTRHGTARHQLVRAVLVVAAGYGLCATLFVTGPASGATAALSVLPPLAPVLMPARIAAGVVPGWQVVLALVLAAAALAGVAWRGGRAYALSISAR